MTHVKVYDIDFSRLVRWLLPFQIRKPRFIAWLNILAAPFVYVYQNFLRFRKQKLYELMITPQVCYMETMLNDRFDFTNRGIYIEDGIEKEPLYIYRDAELKPVYLFTDGENNPVNLYTDSEAGEDTDDFIVWVPIAIIFDADEMKSLVKKFCLPGMKFKIQTF